RVESALGDLLTPAEREALVRRVYENLGRNLVDFAILPRILRAGRCDRFVRLADGHEDRIAAARGRGAVFVSGHIGNCAVLGIAPGLSGSPLPSVARPIDNPFLDGYAFASRQFLGQTIVGKRGALAALVPVLRAGGYAGLLVDQDARRRGIFVEFFGRPAATMSSAATLAYR